MLRMNHDAEQFQAALGQMAAQMLGVDSGGPAREGQLQGDQQRLQTADQRAQASGQQLQTARTGAQSLQQSNEAALTQATTAQGEATDRANQCSDAVAERQEHATSLAEQLKAWAAAHQAARQRAIAETEKRLESQGLVVVRSSEA